MAKITINPNTAKGHGLNSHQGTSASALVLWHHRCQHRERDNRVSASTKKTLSSETSPGCPAILRDPLTGKKKKLNIFACKGINSWYLLFIHTQITALLNIRNQERLYQVITLLASILLSACQFYRSGPSCQKCSLVRF